jgi:hypothetical protein
MQNAQQVDFAIKRLAPKLSQLTAGKEGPHLALTPVVHEGVKGCAELFRWSVLLRIHNQHWLLFCHSAHDAVVWLWGAALRANGSRLMINDGS